VSNAHGNARAHIQISMYAFVPGRSSATTSKNTTIATSMATAAAPTRATVIPATAALARSALLEDLMTSRWSLPPLLLLWPWRPRVSALLLPEAAAPAAASKRITIAAVTAARVPLARKRDAPRGSAPLTVSPLSLVVEDEPSCFKGSLRKYDHVSLGQMPIWDFVKSKAEEIYMSSIAHCSLISRRILKKKPLLFPALNASFVTGN